MLCDIVIAHYNENLKWVNHLKHNNIRHINLYHKKFTSKIFTKHQFISKNQKIKNFTLPNIGRESHTYFTYCIDNYFDIADFVFFVQGNPDAHGFNYKYILKYIDIISKQSHIKFTPNFRSSSMFLGLKNGRLSHWAHSETQPSKYNMSEWFKQYICKDEINLDKANICFGANFGVSKDRILSRNMEEYINIRDKELSTINPESGHFMERSWFYLFNLHKI